MNTTTLGYKGSVEISIRYKGKLLTFKDHNAGTPYLKKSFARVLTGNFRPEFDTPQVIDLECSVDGGETWQTYLKNPVDITAKSIAASLNGTSTSATFTATIASSDLTDVIEEDSPSLFRFSINTNILPDSDDRLGGTYQSFAKIYADAFMLSKIVPGSQAIVKWNMQLVDVAEG